MLVYGIYHEYKVLFMDTPKNFDTVCYPAI